MSVPDPAAVVTEPSPAAPPPAPPPAPAPSAVTPGAAGDQLLDGDLPDQPLFDLGYVKDLRGRAQNYRQQLRDVQAAQAAYSVFDAYEPDDRAVWIDLATTWQQNPEEAARVMQQIATSVLGGGAPPPMPAASNGPTPSPSGSDVDDDGELTADRVQQLITAALAAEGQKRAEAQAVEQVHAEVRTAGYQPDSLEGMMILHLAYTETNGDIKAAVSKLQARDQAAFDAKVAAARNGQAPLAPSHGAPASSVPDHSTSWEDTRKAAQSFLSGAQSGAAGQA